MANLYVSEYERAQDGPSMPIPAMFWGPAVVVQAPVAIGATHAESAAFGANTRFVRLHTDTTCCVLIGASPAATTSSQRMTANQTEYFAVRGSDKVSVIAST